jgi:hypothetical protein
MPSLNFKHQFADQIISGQKRQTIRANRKRPWQVGDTLHLFTGLRGAGTATRLGRVILYSVQQIRIDARQREVHLETIISNGNRHLACLADDEARKLAQADGFASLDDFFRFFMEEPGGGLGGHLLKW